MGITNAMVTNETPQRLAENFWNYFTRILVDAPCSGEGMFRKNDEACSEWSLSAVQMCAERQDEILDCAASMLAPGGRLVYSTCTFAPAENEGSMMRFLARHPEFYLEDTKKTPGMSRAIRLMCLGLMRSLQRQFVSGRIICGERDTILLSCARKERACRKPDIAATDVKRASRSGM